MTEEGIGTAGMRAVTLSREYGSSGGEIAARLAERLGWQMIDHEVVVRVAQQLHVSEADAEAYDERVESLATRILDSLRLLQPMMPPALDVPHTITSQAFYEARCQVIDGAIATGQVVIVGRGAQAHLANRRDVLHVRIVAPLAARIAYVMRREQRDEAAARTRILRKDEERRRYLQTFYQRQPSDAHLYDIILNTGILDLDSAVDLIALALERKARRLALPAEQLGPVAGLAPYPGQPEDFRPPR
jgi:cytidylate kinase